MILYTEDPKDSTRTTRTSEWVQESSRILGCGEMKGNKKTTPCAHGMYTAVGVLLTNVGQLDLDGERGGQKFYKELTQGF